MSETPSSRMQTQSPATIHSQNSVDLQKGNTAVTKRSSRSSRHSKKSKSGDTLNRHISKEGHDHLLRIATWNMKGEFTFKRIGDTLGMGGFDGLLLCHSGTQETSPNAKSRGFTNSYSNSRVRIVYNAYVAIVTPHTIDSWSVSSNQRTIQADITIDGHPLRLVATYIPPPSSQSNQRLAEETFEDVTRIAKEAPKTHHLIIGGDFNARPKFPDFPPDIHVGGMQWGDPNANSPRLLRLLLDADLCLPDTFLRKLCKRRWTWKNPFTKEYHQLDHFLCRTSERPIFRGIDAREDVGCGSDHRLVSAVIDLQLNQKLTVDDTSTVSSSNVMKQRKQPPNRYMGVVEWFDSSKGFGCVSSTDFIGDIFVHRNQVRQTTPSLDLKQGTNVSFVVRQHTKTGQNLADDVTPVVSTYTPPLAF